MSRSELDAIDHKILASLAGDARKPYLEIARECGISGAAIHQRVSKLEESGVITGSRLLVKPSTLGLGVCAFVCVSLSETTKYHAVIDDLKAVPEVVECHFVTGKYALLLKVYCRDNDHFIGVLLHHIQPIPYVQETETMIALETAFERQVDIKDSLQK